MTPHPVIARPKDWGRNYDVWQNGVGPELHYAVIDAGPMRSSVHYHLSKSNLFFLVAGRMTVEFYGPALPGDQVAPAAPTHHVVLGAGDRLVVPSRTWHRFVALEPCELVELYWADPPTIADIVRSPQAAAPAAPCDGGTGGPTHE